jgi:hypothetical protein
MVENRQATKIIDEMRPADDASPDTGNSIAIEKSSLYSDPAGVSVPAPACELLAAHQVLASILDRLDLL